MDPNGKKFLQDVVYDWKPFYCEKCQTIGHSCLVQMKANTHQLNQVKKEKVVQEWRTKAPAQTVPIQKEAIVQQIVANAVHTEPNEPPNLITEKEKQIEKGKQVQSLEFNFINFHICLPLLLAIDLK